MISLNLFASNYLLYVEYCWRGVFAMWSGPASIESRQAPVHDWRAGRQEPT
jgi:hypothetical protein